MSTDRNRRARTILYEDLDPSWPADVDGSRRIGPEPLPRSPILFGRRHGQCLRPGLFVHGGEVRNLRDLTMQFVQGETLRLVVLLEGQMDVSFGPRRLGLDAALPGRQRYRPQAAFVALREPELITRRIWRGKAERKVVVTFSREWLAGTCPGDDALHRLLDRHLAIERWTPTPRAVALAEQLVRPPEQPPLLQKLYLESRAIELAAEALRQLSDASPTSAALRPRERRRVVEVRDWLDDGAAEGLTLAQIARRAGTNASTLQQQFRTAFGTTVFEHLRERRLLRARRALEQEGRSVGEAAALAGYTSAANFATAFKRQFGITPRQCRTGF